MNLFGGQIAEQPVADRPAESGKSSRGGYVPQAQREKRARGL
jgi:hypothetical protein